MTDITYGHLYLRDLGQTCSFKSLLQVLIAIFAIRSDGGVSVSGVPEINLQHGTQQMKSEHLELESQDSSLQTILMLYHRVVEQLMRVSHLTIDEPGQVRSRVTTVRGTVESATHVLLWSVSIIVTHYQIVDIGLLNHSSA